MVLNSQQGHRSAGLLKMLLLFDERKKKNPKTIRLLLLLLLSRDIYHKIGKSISLFLLQPAYKCQSVTFYFLMLIASVRIFSLLFFPLMSV